MKGIWQKCSTCKATGAVKWKPGFAEGGVCNVCSGNKGWYPLEPNLLWLFRFILARLYPGLGEKRDEVAHALIIVWRILGSDPDVNLEPFENMEDLPDV
jgi:hypothetical protein